MNKLHNNHEIAKRHTKPLNQKCVELVYVRICRPVARPTTLHAGRASLLVVGNGRIVDDSRFPVDVCENRDVWIHPRSKPPYRLAGYAT